MEGKNINCHAHCFDITHVPEEFFDELIGGKHFLHISQIKNSKTLQFVLKLMTSRFMQWAVGLFSPMYEKKLSRLNGLVRYSLIPGQVNLIAKLNEHYKDDYRFVLLTMDMDHMEAGSPEVSFIEQVREIQEIKNTALYKNKIYPFIFADPRKANVLEIVKEFIEDPEVPFSGIKLYPALGYYPFDKRLITMYEYAEKNELPLITHTIVGDVYLRNKEFWKTNPIHEISQQRTVPEKYPKYKEPMWFQYNFTHPLNYECLLNPKLASAYFGREVDLHKLKLCIGHFGGDTEWKLYYKQLKKKDDKKFSHLFKRDPLDINQQWLGEDHERLNWLTIIKELIRKYPNVYADISFTLHDDAMYPMLQEMLKDTTINERVLFGTDYYVVATENDEPELIEMMNKYLTPQEIQMIAFDNPKRFLSSELNKVN